MQIKFLLRTQCGQSLVSSSPLQPSSPTSPRGHPPGADPPLAPPPPLGSWDCISSIPSYIREHAWVQPFHHQGLVVNSLFGDGAGAVIVGAGPVAAIEHNDRCRTPSGIFCRILTSI